MGKRIFALFVFVYLLTLLVSAPASLLDRGLQQATKGRLVLANASGTLWNGAATPALRAQDGRLVALQSLHWEVAAASLPAGKIKVRLQWDELPPASATEATISFGQVELHHVQLQFPAQVLGEASPVLKPAQFRGQLQVRSEHLLLTKSGVDGTAVVEWQHAASALSSIDPLGNYRLALNGAGNSIHIGLATVSGILLLEGQGNWLAGRGLEFHGRAQASAGNYDSLTELLHHLGPEESPGVHGFNLVPQ